MPPSNPIRERAEQAGALVMFGITGDLAKKLVIPALYRLEVQGLLDRPVVGVARSDWDLDDLRKHARESIEGAFDDIDEEAYSRFSEELSYVQGQYQETATFDRLKEALGERVHSAVYHLAVPPPMFATVAAALDREGLSARSRLVVEKPFGHDGVSARALDEELRQYFPEDRLFRVDHFLGKESVEGLFALRFANRLLESVWSHEHIRSVQISFPERLDVADRGGFYDGVGTVRDVVQNHLLQVLAYLATEPPGPDAFADGADALADADRHERQRLLGAVRTLSSGDAVRGQYEGYRTVDGVDPGSTTETFVAMRLTIDTPRWEGVPFYVRTGKCLPDSALEIVVELEPARLRSDSDGAPDLLRLRLQPDCTLRYELRTKAPGDGYTTRVVPLAADLQQGLEQVPLPYEQVIADALAGSHDHFATQKFVEESWRIVDPILDPGDDPLPYPPGSWGPADADKLPGPEGWWPLTGFEPGGGASSGGGAASGSGSGASDRKSGASARK